MPLFRLPNELELGIYFAKMPTTEKRRHFIHDILNQKPRLTPNHFEFLHIIGRGGYSKVVCARKKDSGRLYAIKIISKSLVENETISARIIMNEVEVQVLLKDDPFFVNLHYTFQDDENFYLATEL